MSEYISSVIDWTTKVLPALPQPKEIEKVIIREVEMHRGGDIFVRLAGLSGAIAVAMGAYGAHGFKDADPGLKLTYETGNRYHLLHSVALLAVPLTRRPQLVGTLMLVGMTLFSGSCYYHALTGNTAIRRVTPYGGMLLIAGWTAIFL